MDKKIVREVAMYVVGLLIVLAVIFVVTKLFAADMPTANRDAIMLTIGAIIGWGTTVVGFFFGSSKGSADKSEQLKQG